MAVHPEGENILCDTPIDIGNGEMMIPCSDRSFVFLAENGTLLRRVTAEGWLYSNDKAAFDEKRQTIFGLFGSERTIGASTSTALLGGLSKLAASYIRR